MQNALSFVNQRVPYNNFSFVFEGTEYQMLESLGGDCAYQAEKLVEQLRSGGYESFFVYSTDVCHVAVVANKDGKLYFMDPLLMHAEPIPISDLAENEDVIFPSIDENEHVKITLVKEGILRVVLEKKSGSEWSDIWKRDFNIKDLQNEVAEEFKKRTRMDIGDKISLHVPDLRQGINWRVMMKVFGGDICILRSNHGFASQRRGPETFNKKIEEVARCLSLSPDQLIDVFNNACSKALGGIF